MRMFAVCDNKDVLTGLRLAGIEGSLARDRREIEAKVDMAQMDPEIAVLLITETCADYIPERVKTLKLSSSTPLLVIIPDTEGSKRRQDSITSLIREAIGIKV